MNNFACVLGRRGFARTDSPHGLIGDDGLSCILFWQIGQTTFDLGAYYLFGLSSLVLSQVLADADNWSQMMFERGQCLLIDQLIVFGEVHTAFGVSQNDGGAHFAYH